ncbi:hypothetical protein, partial [Streptomyces sp. NPDC059201]|uniref:hypothetical protein n=1 Tax=Streptomyces sp. NPDC059201 TaxID=3346767 RepID=UPI0036746BFD
TGPGAAARAGLFGTGPVPAARAGPGDTGWATGAVGPDWLRRHGRDTRQHGRDDTRRARQHGGT